MAEVQCDVCAGAAGPGAAAARRHGGAADVGGPRGGEAEGRDPVPEGADPGGAVPEGEPGGHAAAGDRGLQGGNR